MKFRLKNRNNSSLVNSQSYREKKMDVMDKICGIQGMKSKYVSRMGHKE